MFKSLPCVKLAFLFGDIVFSMDFDFSECFVDQNLKVRRIQDTHTLLVNEVV